MADFTKSSNLGVDTDSMLRCIVLGQGKIAAGEAIGKLDAIYLKSDGKFYKAVSTVKVDDVVETGTTDFSRSLSGFAGLAYKAYAAGELVTCLGLGAIVDYETDMTPGAYAYVSDTAGKLADAQVATEDLPVAMAIDARRLLVIAAPRIGD